MMNLTKPYTATRNACKMCTPLGAALVFHGIEGTVPLLHGSQGCATYMRRYLISHFKEPVDIASSNFSEETAIFGGGANLKLAIRNVRRQYSPEMIGIATTCLSETIGDDVPGILESLGNNMDGTSLVHVATPSYTGTHVDGFHGAVRAVVKRCNPLNNRIKYKKNQKTAVNLFPGMLSNEDLRHLKEILDDFDTPYSLLPDFSERLEGPSWVSYQAIQQGGTPISSIQMMNRATASFEFGSILGILVENGGSSAAGYLESHFRVPRVSLGYPVGARSTDHFFSLLSDITGRPVPEKYKHQRSRLIDSYVDGNKYVSKKRAVVYGEEDFVAAMAGFLAEIGVVPVLCASGGNSGYLKQILLATLPKNIFNRISIHQGMDFTRIEEMAKKLNPDFLIGNSKGYTMARHLDIPLVRVGFPIHDRVGGPRILHIGYKGTQQLFDAIINTLLQKRQDTSTVGYSYM